MEKMLTDMLQKQEMLNNTTAGVNWKTGVTEEGDVIDWKRCIVQETAELVDSYPWKHWKDLNTTVDKLNVKIELVDIWHFVMSLTLQRSKLPLEQLVVVLIKCRHLHTPGKTPTTPLLHIDAFNKVIVNYDTTDTNTLYDPIVAFFRLIYELGMSLDDVYFIYNGKHTLNQFRQDYGYKEGTYNKNWYGAEDNIVMMRLLEKHPDITMTDLYEKLGEQYGV